MTKKQYAIYSVLLILMLAVLVFELIRDASFTGDFIGYVNAGNAVLSQQNIYADYLNTWPPFFSVFSVVLALGDAVSSYAVRFIWLLTTVFAWFYIIKSSVHLILKKPLAWKKDQTGILLQDPIIVVPLLVILRYVMDNLTNIQINIFMLLGALLCFQLFIKKKYVWVGLILGLTISLKVYTTFILFYFLFKREFKPVLWTMVFLVAFNAITFLVFGFDQALHYYQHWATEVAPKSYVANHKNQSVFGAFLRFFTTENPDHNLYVNFLELNASTVKKLTYLAIAAVSIVPAFLFRKKLVDRTSTKSIFEYAIIFTVIPILSPVAWKAYFIFLWIPYLLLYASLYRVALKIDASKLKVLKVFYWLSVILTVGSTELIVGNYFSDVMEAYSAITFGTIILLGLQLYLVMRIDDFDLESITFKEKLST